ncbi:substrate-binding domain-containing protein [uncultured Microbacterium sp.]|uniref:substrate-binding domain-containing protein n=1 Tax=uncultured Microbacterium sp. TaxID=191216 RepID=UPI0028F1329B|nr:substrate-binding domain-containing protein [uncultured Microbacterium sp.]
MVLLLVPDWEVAGQFGVLLEEIGRLVAKYGLVCLRYEGEHWRGSLSKLLGRIPSACVITFDVLHGDDMQALSSAGVPEVSAQILDRPGQPHTITLGQDTIVEAQIDHLISEGYRRLAYLATDEPRGQGFINARIDAFHRICGTRGIPDHKSAIVSASVEGISQTIEQWGASLESPLGIVAWNDITALGVLSAAQNLAMPVPEGLGVIGGDNTPVAALSYPGISSVRLDLPSEAEQIALRVAKTVGYEPDVSTPTAPHSPVEVIRRASTHKSV